MKNKKIDIEITRLYMYKAGKRDWKRRFMGSIKEGVNSVGNPVICGKVEVNDCTIYAQAPDEEQLGEQMDELVLMILDYGLHKDEGVFNELCNTRYFLN